MKYYMIAVIYHQFMSYPIYASYSFVNLLLCTNTRTGINPRIVRVVANLSINLLKLCNQITTNNIKVSTPKITTSTIKNVYFLLICEVICFSCDSPNYKRGASKYFCILFISEYFVILKLVTVMSSRDKLSKVSV